MGRPAKLNTAVTEKLLNALRQGMGPTKACRLAGIALQTYYRWMREGAAQASRDKVTFRRRVNQAYRRAAQRHFTQAALSKPRRPLFRVCVIRKMLRDARGRFSGYQTDIIENGLVTHCGRLYWQGGPKLPGGRRWVDL